MVSNLDFLLYLTSSGREIIEIIKSSNYRIKQNSAICRNADILGYKSSDEFIICLNNIKNKVSPVQFYVMTDNIMAIINPEKAKHAQITFGFNFICCAIFLLIIKLPISIFPHIGSQFM